MSLKPSSKLDQLLVGLTRFRSSADPASQLPYSIVYLDDELELLEPFEHLATDLGFGFFGSTNPTEVEDYIRANASKIAFIFSDYKMPLQDGFQFREKILNDHPTIPFAILSGLITRDLALKGLALKISAFLDKPVKADPIVELLLKDGLPRLSLLQEEAELLSGFLAEAGPIVDSCEQIALQLEQIPGDIDAINQLFGYIHTLKGASGYFSPKTLYQFIHRFEDLLKEIQKGTLAVTPERVSSILGSIDLIKVLVSEFRTGEHTPRKIEALFDQYFNHSSAVPDAPKNTEAPQVEKHKKSTPLEQTDLRVPVRVLDDFIQSSGEMTVIRNMIDKCVRAIETTHPGNRDVATLSELMKELHRINSSIQDQMVQVRKVPVSSVLRPVPRIVRDTVRDLKKQVHLVIQGEQLLIDTAVASILNKCIVHLVRNSLDHGIEAPDVRLAAGKAAEGTLQIEARELNDQVVLTLKDDGKGIDDSRIRAKLVANRSHSEEQAAALSIPAVYSMIFEPGFSTAEKVTELSGRGVGMSAVKEAVNSLGGTIEIESTLGKGTCFTLLLPVPKSVLIQDCLFVLSEGRPLGIPQSEIRKVLRVQEVERGPESKDSKIYQTASARTLEFEGRLISIYSLRDLLKLPPCSSSSGAPSTFHKNRGRAINLVIVGNREASIALEVDQIGDIQDSVIKPLPAFLKAIGMYLGATFLEDGTVGLILSTDGILEKMEVNTRPALASHAKLATQESHLSVQSSSPTYLLIRSRHPTIYAVDSSSIFRIENLNSADLAVHQGKPALPYREQSLTLAWLSDLLGESPRTTDTRQPELLGQLIVLVTEFKKHFVGIVIDSLLDLVSLQQELSPSLQHTPGIKGVTTAGDCLVTLLDFQEALEHYLSAPSMGPVQVDSQDQMEATKESDESLAS
jgi:two-component system chemotaxis sensor kinase CheA